MDFFAIYISRYSKRHLNQNFGAFLLQNLVSPYSGNYVCFYSDGSWIWHWFLVLAMAVGFGFDFCSADSRKYVVSGSGSVRVQVWPKLKISQS